MATRWTPEELLILDRAYPVWGSRGVHDLLPHRSMDSIKLAARWRNVKYLCRRPWTAEEAATVAANYPSLGGRGTAALPGRSPQDVSVYANSHGVYRIWEAA